ncbi:MAG: SWIM zinc finger family protein [Clostridia bacterium]|nr:SWIM zinc finger family protein [Clostridia bacterium]
MLQLILITIIGVWICNKIVNRSERHSSRKSYNKSRPISVSKPRDEDLNRGRGNNSESYNYDYYVGKREKYKHCPDCFLKNPVDRWYCLECGHGFGEEEPLITSHEHPFSYNYWLSPKFRTQHQRTRFRRASQIQLKSHSSDYTYTTVFSSDFSTVYEVTPESCTCQDFFKRGLPCKHMYAVMIQAGVISSISALYNLPSDISFCIDNLQRISKDAAREFALYLRYKRFSSNRVIVDRSNDVFKHLPTIASLSLIAIDNSISDELIAYVEKTYTADDFRELCSAVVPELKLPKLKKRDLIAFALLQKVELSEYFSNLFRLVCIPENIFTRRKEIFDYYFEEYPDAA